MQSTSEQKCCNRGQHVNLEAFFSLFLVYQTIMGTYYVLLSVSVWAKHLISQDSLKMKHFRVNVGGREKKICQIFGKFWLVSTIYTWIALGQDMIAMSHPTALHSRWLMCSDSLANMYTVYKICTVFHFKYYYKTTWVLLSVNDSVFFHVFQLWVRICEIIQPSSLSSVNCVIMKTLRMVKVWI